jgi:hypothetical protein
MLESAVHETKHSTILVSATPFWWAGSECLRMPAGCDGLEGPGAPPRTHRSRIDQANLRQSADRAAACLTLPKYTLSVPPSPTSHSIQASTPAGRAGFSRAKREAEQVIPPHLPKYGPA